MVTFTCITLQKVFGSMHNADSLCEKKTTERRASSEPQQHQTLANNPTRSIKQLVYPILT